MGNRPNLAEEPPLANFASIEMLSKAWTDGESEKQKKSKNVIGKRDT